MTYSKGLIKEQNEYKIGHYQYKKQELINIIQDYEIVSFDVFDTLIMRKTMFSADVFDIVSQKMKKDYINIEDFRNQRIKADSDIAQTSPNIYEIYNQLKKNTGISESEKIESYNVKSKRRLRF